MNEDGMNFLGLVALEALSIDVPLRNIWMVRLHQKLAWLSIDVA